jgi:hypothetical protein
MKPTFFQTLKAAFNARPIGMFVPPNWIALAGFAMAGLVHPGFWLIGAGIELAYLFGLTSNARFQRYVAGKDAIQEQADWQTQLQRMLRQLDSDSRERYWRLQRRCASIIEQQQTTSVSASTAPLALDSPEIAAQGEGLSKLLFLYLRLLRTRQAITRVLSESIDLDREREPLDRRMVRLQAELQGPGMNDNLRKSLEGQIEILGQRLEKRQETREKLKFLDAELVRIEEQVELIREQAVISTEPTAVSARIDQIAATLGGTQQWIRDQQSILGSMDDALVDPPPLMATTGRAMESN